MAINFPATPTLNQTYTYNGRTWTYNNVGWQATGSTGLTVYTKTNFTATAAQTSFSVTYTVGFVDVYYNGSKLSSSEYTATTGSTVVLGTACSVNDIVETIAWTISSSFNPSLGSASATSLAIGGATIGSNALAVTGTTALSGLLTAAGGVSSTLTTDASSSTTGSIITAGGISTQKALWVGTTSRLVGNVQADANVGIGTSTNYAPLAVNFANPTGSSGNGVLANFRNSQTGGTNTGAFIGFETGGTYSWIHGLVGASGSSLVWINGSAAEKMRLDLSGNLLLGTTTAQALLTVKGATQIIGTGSSTAGGSGPSSGKITKQATSSTSALSVSVTGTGFNNAGWVNGVIKITAAGGNLYSGNQGGIFAVYNFQGLSGFTPRNFGLMGTAMTSGATITISFASSSSETLVVTASMSDGNVPGSIPSQNMSMTVEVDYGYPFTLS